MRTRWSIRIGVLMAAGALAVGVGPAAWAAGGQTTPGATVTAVNPGFSRAGSDLGIALYAHSQASTVANPSCRPEDANLTCVGALVVRVPKFGGMVLSGFQVHRVAVGDISCGDDEGGGCGGDMTATRQASDTTPVTAQVNGLSTIRRPGASGLPKGTQVQVKITLTDNGRARYRDTVDLQINQFVPGPTKPLVYDTGPQTVLQVLILSPTV